MPPEWPPHRSEDFAAADGPVSGGGLGQVRRAVQAQRRPLPRGEPAAELLRAVRITEAVPRSPAGKLLRRVLAEAERSTPQ